MTGFQGFQVAPEDDCEDVVSAVLANQLYRKQPDNSDAGSTQTGKLNSKEVTWYRNRISGLKNFSVKIQGYV